MMKKVNLKVQGYGVYERVINTVTVSYEKGILELMHTRNPGTTEIKYSSWNLSEDEAIEKVEKLMRELDFKPHDHDDTLECIKLLQKLRITEAN